MGLRDSEFTKIVELLGREPTHTELGMFAVMWSEHCGYKHSRPVLAYFKRYKAALEGEGFENAGVVDIGDGWGVTMKIESHNHPSAVEPYQGAATGVGGILRDIFTMGARPVALLNSLRFGPIRDGEAAPEVVARNRYLFEHVVEGIGGYGNCVGVPTVGGEAAFHPRYSRNPLVNAMAVGIVRLGEVATAAAPGEGAPVIYMGSATGKDGIHGATFASDALGEDSQDKRPNVQIGDPFVEKLLIEATLEALATGAVAAIQDMGAAGLTCSTVEMASKGGAGMSIDLDLVPTREEGMSAYELMLSESQERMLCIAHQGREDEVLAVCRKWGLCGVVIGQVTSDGLVTVRRHGKVEVCAPAGLFTGTCPTYTTPFETPAYHIEAQTLRLNDLPEIDPQLALMRLLASPDVASKRWVFEQFDQQVQTQTVLLPGQGDACVIAPRGTGKGIALTIDGNGRKVYLDPYVGGLLAVCEAARNVACVGARPLAITDGLNFGNPETPHVYWQFERAVKGIADAAEALGTPVISGNVSFYNESDLGEVLPTPKIGMLGVLDRPSDRVGLGLPAKSGGLMWVSYPVDDHLDGLGASHYLAELHGVESGLPCAPDLTREAALHRVLAALGRDGLLLAAHDASEGGPLVAVAEMVIGGHAGAQLRLDAPRGRLDALLFGERPGEVFLAVEESLADEVGARIEAAGLRFVLAGVFGPSLVGLTVDMGGRRVLEASRAELTDTYECALPSLMRH
jgi:phosphoribosylformylglycinamidine synthase